MPTYHNAGCGYQNVSSATTATRQQSKLDGNQNHHTIPSYIVAAASTHLVCQPSCTINSSGSNSSSSIVTSSSSSTSNSSQAAASMTSLLGLPNSNNSNNSNVLVGNSTRHEVKLNAMP